jgi:hypothetical protein
MRIPVSESLVDATLVPGVVLVLSPGDGASGLRYELERADDVAGAPGTWSPWQRVRVLSESGQSVVDFATSEGALRWYRARLIGPGVDPGPWAVAVRGVAVYLPARDQVSETIYPLQRARAMSDGSYAGQSVTPDGTTLPPGTVQTDGVGPRGMLKGWQSGSCRDGDAVVFDPPFAVPPTVRVTGGLAYEPRAAQWTGGTFNAAEPQYELVEAVGLSSSGFTMRAKLRQPVASVLRTDAFPTTPLTTVGDTAVVTIANAPAYDEQYTATWVVEYENETGVARSASVRVAVDVSADAGLTYTERGSGLFTELIAAFSFGSRAFSVRVAAAGLDPTDRVRLRLVSLSGTSVILSAVPGSVTYQTAGSVRVATKTPDTTDRVEWTAYAKE